MEKVPVQSVETKEGTGEEEEMTSEFLRLSKEEIRRTRERIRGIQGHVRISVHPLYIGRWPGTYPGPRDEAWTVHNDLKEGLERTTRSVNKNQKSAPLFIFEEGEHMKQSSEDIAESLGFPTQDLVRHGFLFVPTQTGSGDLSDQAASLAYEKVHAVPPEETYEKLSARREELVLELVGLREPYKKNLTWGVNPYTEEDLSRWLEKIQKSKPLHAELRAIRETFDVRRRKVFSALCHSLEIRSALISGAYFYAISSGSTGDKKLSGCAGGVTTDLRNAGVQVDISRHSSMSREKIQEEGFDTKQTGK